MYGGPLTEFSVTLTREDWEVVLIALNARVKLLLPSRDSEAFKAAFMARAEITNQLNDKRA